MESGIKAALNLQSEWLNEVASVQLQVNDDELVKGARQVIGEKTAVLDVLINNAGKNGGTPPYSVLTATTEEHSRKLFCEKI